MNNERDIDKIIADKLRKSIDSMPAQEYEQGAWENFKVANAAHIKVRRVRNIRIFSYSTIGVAAMLLVGLFLFNTNNSIAVIESPIAVIESPILSIKQPLLSLKMPVKIGTKRAIKSVGSAFLTEKKHPAEEVTNEEVTNEEVTKEEVTAQTKEESWAYNRAIKEKAAQTKEEVSAFKENNKEKLLRFGVNISPGFNSTSINSGSTFNYSGGVTMDITIAKNLQISTGIQIEHQSVDGEVRASVAELVPSHIDAVLTNLDIPINITWHFFNDKSRSYYISGGFSSLAYLDEKYTTVSYDNQLKANTIASSADEKLTTYRIENVETVRTTVVSPSNSMDVAGRINLILGYEQRLSPKLNLHIEPFIKIPLTGLASENMRFTTGGVTFKISF